MLSIILVEPQLGWNIGAAARAMLNFQLTDMRIVNPRDGWPNPDALSMASGADQVLENAKIYSCLQKAIADLNHVYATTARSHDMIKYIYSPQGAVEQLYQAVFKNERVGILFGNERCGLSNEDISFSEAIIQIPSNPDFRSLNMAHSVSILAYEWQKYKSKQKDSIFRTGQTKVAKKKDLNDLFEHLEKQLILSGFLNNVKKRPTMIRNIRNMLQRAQLTEQEIRTFRGIITSLSHQANHVFENENETMEKKNKKRQRNV